MEIRDMAAFAHIMAGLGELYGKAVSEILTELYWVALKRFDIMAIREAVTIHINNPDAGRFMPKPADLVGYLEGHANARALSAWSKVIHAIKHLGHYETLVFDDPLIHAVIDDMGGWISLCKVTEKDLSFRSHEFEKRYQNYLRHPPHHYPKQLTGSLNVANRTQGFATNLPILIGDEQRALHVYLGGEHAAKRYKLLSFEEVKPLEKHAGSLSHSSIHPSSDE
jgi:hypothetical protein